MEKINTIVNLLRHGETNYLENDFTEKEKEALETTPIDLTENGIDSIRESAEKLAQTLDIKKDIIVLWSSPAWRAQDSELILENVLKTHGFSVYKNSEISLMEPIIFSKDNPNESKLKHEKAVKKNAEGFFNWIEYITKRMQIDLTKRLRIVGVSHYEFLNPIMEDIFNFKSENGDGFKKGEILSIEFVFDKNEDKMDISASMRGKTVDGIVFDKELRKFVHK